MPGLDGQSAVIGWCSNNGSGNSQLMMEQCRELGVKGDINGCVCSPGEGFMKVVTVWSRQDGLSSSFGSFMKKQTCAGSS